ncbi:MAG: hypothetical protein HY862_19240 [Chloroflexi bacterium]|nr:hypothetical protein [Chloroflexota bacterium]
MYREPDWEALNDLNFLLHNRLVSPLNGALSALEKSAPTTNPDWWHTRATSQVSTALNLVNAWSWLVQYKALGQIPERSIQPFPIQSLADWLTMQLQLVPPLIIAKNFLLRANQAALQEAIFLLYDVASSQGTSTKLILDTGSNGVMFRIRFTRLRESKPFNSLEEMETSLGQHWRGNIITFELKTAREFLRMNSSDLQLRDGGSKVEFVFVISRKIKAENGETESHLLIPSPDSQAVINIAEATLPAPHVLEQEPLVVEAATAQLAATITPEESWVLKPTTIRASAEIPTATSSVRAMVPDTPFRPGGWYRPKRASNPPSLPVTTTEVAPVIVKVELPAPAEPGDFKVKSRRSQRTSQTQIVVAEESSSVSETGPQQILQEAVSEEAKAATPTGLLSPPPQQAEPSADTQLPTTSPDASGQASLERKNTHGL